MNNSFLLRKYTTLFLIFALYFSASAATKKYFVSTSGNDSNSGSDVKHAFATITKAVNSADAGDSVFVMPGLYKKLIEVNGRNGMPEKPIFLIGYSSDPKKYPVIDGGAAAPGVDMHFDWIHFENSSWIEVSRLKFQNGWTFPIDVKNSSYLTFRDCNFEGGKRVINVGGALSHHILVEKCYWNQGGEYLWRVEKDDKGVEAWLSMHHVNMSYFNGSIIDFSGSGGSIVVRGNKIVNAFNGVRYRGQPGFDTNVEIYDNEVSQVRDNDFEPEYYTYNLHIYHNRSHNIHRNLSIDNVEGGLIFYYGNVITTDDDDWTRKICSGIWKIYGKDRVLSYPIYDFNNSYYSVGKLLEPKPDMARVNHFNNAFFFLRDSSWQYQSWNDENHFDYDITNQKWLDNFVKNNQEQHGRVADIKFRNGKTGDLRLRKDSPGIDAGKVMAFEDFGWKQSFTGNAPDVGAFEGENLIDGPPFRFLLPPGVKTEYAEKPRIVRHYIDGKRCVLYFSAELDPSTVSGDSFILFNGKKKLNLISATFPNNNYELVLMTDEKISDKKFSISFNKIPVGKNGENATGWASTVRIRK